MSLSEPDEMKDGKKPSAAMDYAEALELAQTETFFKVMCNGRLFNFAQFKGLAGVLAPQP